MEKRKRKKKPLLRFLLFVGIILLVFFIVGSLSEDVESTESVEPAIAELELADPDGAAEQLSTAFQSNDGFVADMDVVQVMAKGLDHDTGEFYSMTNFVAGKDTLVAVTLSDPSPILQDGSITLTVERDGETVAELLPFNTATDTMALFTPKNQGDVDNWASGEYTFTFNCGDSTGVKTASFREAKAIKILAVPVLSNFDGNIELCGDGWKTGIGFTRDCYPIAKDGIEYVLGNTLDLSGYEYDLNTEDGMYNVWKALAALQTPNDDYELILGFVGQPQGPGGVYSGYTYGKPANIICEYTGDSDATVAHEIAHCYNIGDEYEGGDINNAVNPAPYGMHGLDWANPSVTTSGNRPCVKSAQEFNSMNSGSVVFPEQMPFNTTQLRALGRVGSFMGAGSNNMDDYWISSDIWNHLYKAFVYGNDSYEGMPDASNAMCPSCFQYLNVDYSDAYGMCSSCYSFTQIDPTDDSTSFICESCGEENGYYLENIYYCCNNCGALISYTSVYGLSGKASLSAKTALEHSEIETLMLDVSGTVYSDGRFTPNPWYSYVAQAGDQTAKLDGEYSVLFTDVSGKQLSRQYFDVSFYTQSNPPVKKDYAPVMVTVRCPDGAAEISITRGEEVLYTAVVSPNSPEVAFEGLTENMPCSGKTTVRWTGGDADGDALTYELWYCTENDDYICLGSDLTVGECEVDFDTLPGDDHAYLYLYATDGVNTGEIDSPYLSVGYKAPEIITAQTETQSFALTDEIYLDADVYDMQDGWLYEDDEVFWTLEGRPYISGSALWVYPYELTPGEHCFTLTAVNSQGVTSQRDFNFLITDDEDALPDDWSREEVRDALSNGFIVSLANIDTGITRGQYAELMCTLYYDVWEEGTPDPEYEEGVVTDCGQDDFAQFLMVKLGVMSADNGRFDPNGSLTEAEAANILYQVCYLADPNWFEEAKSADEAVDLCAQLGVLDDSGENAYSPDSVITKQLALVRCSRIFNAVFE